MKLRKKRLRWEKRGRREREAHSMYNQTAYTSLLSSDSTWTSAFLPRNWLLKQSRGQRSSKIIYYTSRCRLWIFTLCFQTGIQDIREQREWVCSSLQDSCYLFVLLFGGQSSSIMQEVGDEPSREGCWAETPWPVLGEHALYSTGPPTSSLV